MKKNHICASSLALLTALSGQSLFAFAEVARGTLTTDADLRFVYDSNVFGNSSEQEDVSIALTPSLSYLRDVARVTTAATVGVTSFTFDDYTEQNSVDPFANVRFDYDGAEKGGASLTLSYLRSTAANEALLTRATSDEYRGSGSVDYYYSEKTGVRVDSGYRVSDFSTAGFANVYSYNIGGGLVYRYSPKLTASATYNFSPEKSSNRASGVGDPSSKNHRFLVGVEGEVAPKVTGNVGVGLAYRDFDQGADSDSTYLVNAGLSWALAQKTSVRLTASNDFDTSGTGQSVEESSLRLGVRQVLTEKINLGASIGYERSDYAQSGVVSARTDDAVIETLDLGYQVNDHWRAGTAVSFRVNDSDAAQATYERFIWSISVSANY